ncbi:MAG: bifunctional hydroxymethylpyrimidine kinase/phosphomethylpyrimidine kinase [Tatlockia sp.]|jgi:hydroxymethylpyrimidine/phosphomethylpyrimidine kinase
MNSTELACILSIAGTDPSGGAGIGADIKAISATGGYAASVITALVAQNTQGVQAIQKVSAQFVVQQLDSVFDDMSVAAVKIGMLHEADIIEAVCDVLIQRQAKNIVFDPVMVAKDGSLLLDLSTIDLLKKRLIGLAYLITPNLFEAEKLFGQVIKTPFQMEEAACSIGKEFHTNVLIKGGHLENEGALDVLFNVTQTKCHWFSAKRTFTRNTHGTGCTLSSAIASYLGQGFPLEEAVSLAKDYLTKAIESGQHFTLGKGNGPVDHFYFLTSRSA